MVQKEINTADETWITRLNRWFIDPLVAVDADLHYKIRVFSLIWFGIIIVAVFSSLPYILANPDNIMSIYITLIGLIFIIGCYVLARMGYYTSAAWAMLTVITLATFALGVSPGENSYLVLIFLLTPILISGVLFNTLTMLLMSGVMIFAMALLPLAFDHLVFEDVMVGPISLVTSLSIILFVGTHFRLWRDQTAISTRAHATEHQIDKQALDQANERFEKVMRSGTVAMALISNEDLRFVEVNDAFCDLCAYARNELINNHIDDVKLWHDENFRVMVNNLGDDTPVYDCETTISTGDGKLLDVRVSMGLIALGNEPCTMLMMPQPATLAKLTGLMTENENRYRIVSELMSDYAYGCEITADDTLNFHWITGAFEQITGYPVEDAHAWQEWVFVYADDVEAYQHMLRQLKQGKSQTLDYRIVTKSGKIRWVRDFARPIFEDNAIIGIYGAVQDRTDQHSAENYQRTHALEQAIMAEIGQKALLKGTTMDVLLEETLPLITQVLNVQYCDVYALSEDKKHLKLYGWVGWDDVTETGISLTNNDIYTQAAYTLFTQEPVTVFNMHAEKRFTPAHRVNESDIQSGLTVLIQGQSDILGVLGVYSTMSYEFNIGDVNFLHAIANTLAAYMEQKRTARKEREQRLLAEALRDTAEVLNSTLEFDAVLDRMMTHLNRVVPYDAASLMLIEGNYATIVQFIDPGSDKAPSSVGKPTLLSDLPLVRYMIDHAEPLVLSDTQKESRWRVMSPETGWIRSYVGAPILFHGELIGILNVDSATPNQFSATDGQRLMAFANQASIAIHNARYAQQLQDEVDKRTAQLNLEHRRLESILKATGEGIFYAEDTVIRFVNDRLCEMFGYRPEELIGQHTTLLEGTTWDDTTAQRWQQARQYLIENRVYRDERQLLRKNGAVFDAALTISLVGNLLYSEDDPITTVTVVRDISQQKRLDKQRESFISNASHELRSPITSINTRLYLMRRKPEEMERHIELLERVVERMNTLIEDLLDRSRLEHDTIQLRSRNVVLQNVVEKITDVMADDAAQSNLMLTTDFIDEPVRVFIDADRMTQVITNIVANAINYTHEGGTITVEIRQGKMPGDDETMYAKINIVDTGIGISAEHLPHIFDEFFRALKHIPGNGLGLNIARQLVRLHGGDITVTSEENKGSTFTIWLPMSTDNDLLL